jgi:hypothetical protein
MSQLRRIFIPCTLLRTQLTNSCSHSSSDVFCISIPSLLLSALPHLLHVASSPCVPSKLFYIVLKSRIPANLTAGHLEVVGSSPFRAIDSEIARVFSFWFSEPVPSHCSDPSSWIRGFERNGRLFNQQK